MFSEGSAASSSLSESSKEEVKGGIAMHLEKEIECGRVVIAEKCDKHHGKDIIGY